MVTRRHGYEASWLRGVLVYKATMYLFDVTIINFMGTKFRYFSIFSIFRVLFNYYIYKKIHIFISWHKILRLLPNRDETITNTHRRILFEA